VNPFKQFFKQINKIYMMKH